MCGLPADRLRCPTPSPAAAHVPLAEVTRGERRRQRPLRLGRGRRPRGPRAARRRRPARRSTFTRSALKPLQAMPFVAGGGVERFGFSAAQVALMCASHSGEPRHVEAVADMLARCGLLGGRPAMRRARARLLRRARRMPPPPPYSPLQHNCSGKHSGDARVLRAVRRTRPRTTSPSTTRCSRRSARAVSRVHRRGRRAARRRASTAARRRTTPCRSRPRARRSRGWRAPTTTRLRRARRARWPTR